MMNIERLFRNRVLKQPVVEFIGRDLHFRSYPPPVPAMEARPGWYLKMARYTEMGEQFLDEPTMRNCYPLRDAMGFGYIVSAPVDIKFHVKKGQIDFSWNSYHDDVLVQKHHPTQSQGAPTGHESVLKLNTPWAVRTPPGYGVLFTAPLNHIELPFQAFSGVIDTDVYYRAVNVPFRWVAPDGEYVVERGTPFVQILPFKREAWQPHKRVHLTEDERKEQDFEYIANARGAKNAYRDNFWIRKVWR